MTMLVALTLNGKTVSADVEPRTLLVQLIRDHFGLTGTHVGCDTVQAEGMEVETIESLAGTKDLHPMQQAFKDYHGLQCGFCTPGVIMSALNLVARNPNPSEMEIREWLEGNLCRCTGYHNIVKAISAGAEAMKD